MRLKLPPLLLHFAWITVASVLLAGVAVAMLKPHATVASAHVAKVELNLDGYKTTVDTSAATVGDLLTELRINTLPQSRIYPPIETAIVPYLSVIVHNPTPWTLEADDQTQTLYTFAPDVGTALTQAQIALGPLDYFEPEASTAVRSDLVVKIFRVNEETVTEEQSIDFSSRTIEDAELEWGKRVVEQQGAEGRKSITYLRRFINGELAEETILDEIIVLEPVTEIIRLGTYRAVVSTSSGIASWFRAPAKTAASRDYPKGTMLKVTNLMNGNSVEVKVNDYGPALYTGRAIDLSADAFAALAPLGQGLIRDVLIEELGR